MIHQCLVKAHLSIENAEQVCKVKMQSTVFEAGNQLEWCNVQNLGG
jgi:hypothetical protein